MRVVSFEEELLYLAKARQPLRDIAQIILDSGLRPEEAFRIRVENLDFAAHNLQSVRENKSSWPACHDDRRGFRATRLERQGNEGPVRFPGSRRPGSADRKCPEGA